jgi:osmotically-inducible protein OsmY
MPANDEVAADVTEELLWDPKVDATAIAVSAEDGRVTMRGTVGSLREKREANKVAARVFGVVAVDDRLQVRILNGVKRADAELRGDVLQALMLNSLVPETVDAKVDDGFVTLTGTADWQYQRDEAERVVANIVGTLGLFNEIELEIPIPDVGIVADDVKRAFERNAKLDADHLSVFTTEGTVMVQGRVSSWAEHDEAIAVAWAAPGVTEVDDRISVEC